jgi:F420H(2)-dependent quinone reductase
MRRAILLAAGAVMAAGGWMLLPNSFFYRDRRPTRLGRTTNRMMAWLTSRLPIPLQVTLEVEGRRSHRTYTTVLVPAYHAGERYLVSMLGERSAWVRNVRAADGRAVLRHGLRKEFVHLEDTPVEQRAPVLQAYLRRAIGARPHFDLTPDAGVEAFERVAAEYPVFRIEREAKEAGWPAAVSDRRA